MANEREKLIKILEDICPGVDFESEEELIDDGLIESLDLVSIVNDIIAEFDIEINVEDLLPENFNSVDAMLGMIEAKRS